MAFLRQLILMGLEGSSPLEVITFAQDHGLIARTVTCSCGFPMSLYPRSDIGDKYSWLCSKCKKRSSIRNGTWFSRSKLPLPKILLLTYMWVSRYPQHIVAEDLPCAPNTVTDWYHFCREICEDVVLSSSNDQIGGPGKIVEIDESKFGKRKYHRGKHVEGDWVFGGVERGTHRCFLKVVENRSSASLVPIIQQYIAPGTTIISDCWKAYDCLGHLGYEHLTVNHSITFKNPETGAHTNTVEGMWGSVKRMFPDCHRTKGMFESYLAQFMYLKMHGGSSADKCLQFFRHVAAIYPPTLQCIDTPQNTPKRKSSSSEAGPSGKK